MIMYDYYRSMEYLNKQFNIFLSDVTGNKKLVTELHGLNDGMPSVVIKEVVVSSDVAEKDVYLALTMLSYAESVPVSSSATIRTKCVYEHIRDMIVDIAYVNSICEKLNSWERKTLKLALCSVVEGIIV